MEPHNLPVEQALQELLVVSEVRSHCSERQKPQGTAACSFTEDLSHVTCSHETHSINASFYLSNFLKSQLVDNVKGFIVRLSVLSASGKAAVTREKES